MKRLIHHFFSALGLSASPARESGATNDCSKMIREVLPAHNMHKCQIDGRPVAVIDEGIFKYMFREWFEKQLYRFTADTPAPTILDCGANIGVSVLYWKSLFPTAKLLAFEPDSQNFSLLEANCQHLRDVTLLNRAVWTCEETLNFSCGSSLGGHIATLSAKTDQSRSCPVRSVRLRDYLHEKVDLLKIDIEGAEVEVLEDCSDRLCNVGFLFVEYHSFIDKPQRLGSFLALLESAGFRLHIQTEMPAKQPFLETPIINGKDLRLGVFARRT